MIFVDTHTHIYDQEFDADRDTVVAEALQAGVVGLLLPSVDSRSTEPIEKMCARHHCCRPMVGFHPESIGEVEDWRMELSMVEKQLNNQPHDHFCAIGEIGLDLYWTQETKEEQREAFEFQLELALKHNLPVAVHVRNAWDQTTDILQMFRGRGLRGVMHAFAASTETYRQVKQLGDFKFGLGGVSTYKNSILKQTIPDMDLDDLVLETDSPYLPPVPYRGKRNQSSYIPYIAARVAELKGITVEQVAATTTRNATELFALDSDLFQQRS